MLQLGIIFFRETIEIVLVISIVMAATHNLPGRNKLVIGGIAIGVISSCILAYFINFITKLAGGNGQELINAFILAFAVIMINWTVLFVGKNKNSFSQKITQLKQDIIEDKESSYAILLLISITIIREGFEIILFSYGIIKTAQISNIDLTLSAAAGFISGIIIGMLIYKGLIKLHAKYFFKVTTGLLILLAASMAAQIPSYLASSGIIKIGTLPLWNSTNLLPESSVLGQTLHMLIGYTAQPSILQILFYLATITVTIIMLNYQNNSR